MLQAAKSRLGWLIGVCGLLVFIAVGAPARLLTHWAYAQERGRIQANSDELASVQEVSRAFRMVANLARPAVVQIRVRGEVEADPDFQQLAEERNRLERRGEELETRLEESAAQSGSGERRALMQEWSKLQREREALGQKARELFERIQSGTGSGVIIDSAGNILTNNHVVERPGRITVRLSDDREYSGKLVGRDPKTDVAVIRIDAPDLHTLLLGNSDEMEVGDWVIAIGAPFGLTQTVTHGIVSAKGRSDVRTEREILYQDFLQTDAAINPGNSGGPLLNLRGEVIGINTAIATNGDAFNAGIAFTIPSNLARKIADKLIAGGTVARGWLGVSLTELGAEDLKVLGGSDEHGVMINFIYSAGPAQQAGLECEDVLLAVNGAKVNSIHRVQGVIADVLPGESALLTVLRDGVVRDVPVVVTRQPDDVAAFVRGSSVGRLDGRWVPKLSLRGRSARFFEPFMLARGRAEVPLTGVVVIEAPAKDGLQPGEVILKVNEQSVRSMADLTRLIEKRESGSLRLEVLDRKLESTRTIEITSD